MMVWELNKNESFHQNGWDLQLLNGLMEFVYDEGFFCITWYKKDLSHRMWFMYGEFNYFEITNGKTNRVVYCTDKNKMKEFNKFMDMWDDARSQCVSLIDKLEHST